MELNVTGVSTVAVGEQCQSLPYGDGLDCTGTDVNQLHFTGKQHDTESGNDYFLARYYASGMAARFLTPDWSKNPQGVPYANYADPQSLDLYSYMRDNPLSGVDPDGHLGLGDAPPCKVMRGTTCANAQDATEFKKEDAKHLAQQQAQQNAAVDSLVAAQDAARANPQNQPAGKTTHCNSATYQVCGAMGANMGVFSGYPGWEGRANAVGKKLAESTDWKTVPIDQVQALANKGVVVIGSYINPHGDGHLVTVRPEGVKGDNPGPGTGPLLNNIGRTVGVMHYSQVFRKTAEVNFYVQK